MNIFISYARADDEPFVKQLYQDLTEHGFDVWWDKATMQSRGRTFLQELRDAIEASDRLIAVIGPNAVISDYVRAEWEHALLFARGVVPILRMGDYDLIPDKLSKFHTPDFRKKRPYKDALDELIRILAEPVPQLGPFRTIVPPLPPRFLSRSDEIFCLAETVLADIQHPTVITSAEQITILHGMGGVGKTALAAAFSRSTETRRAFNDGIIWLTFGQKPDPLKNLKILGLAFHDNPENYVDSETARVHLPSLLADKACLIVLDDIWDSGHVNLILNARGPRCRLLITTRDGGLVTALGSREYHLGVMTDNQAMALLAQWTEQDVENLPEEAKAVAAECGNLPLALVIIGAMVRGKPNRWENILHRLRIADLEKIRKQFPNYPYPDVLKAIQVSVDALEPDIREHYLDFAVFPDKTPIDEIVLQILWEPEGLNEFDTQDITDTLVDHSLVQRHKDGSVILHDLQLDYVRKQVGDMPGLHNRLLEAYQQKCTGGWHTGLNNGYFFEHLAYHLVEAERKEELRELLLDFDWLQAKLEASDINSLIKDYDHLQGNHELDLVQNTLRLSVYVLARDKNQLAAQLLGRLQSFQEPEIPLMLEKASNWKGSVWLRPLTASLIPSGGPLIRTLEGHTDTINSVIVTTDGQTAISVSGTIYPLLFSDHLVDSTLKVWDIKTGELLHSLKGLTDSIYGGVITPDNHRLISISGSWANTLNIWDIETGDLLKKLDGHDDRIEAIAVTPDGRCAISASSDNTMKIWDVETGAELRTIRYRASRSGVFLASLFGFSIKGHTDIINAVAAMPDGRQIITASNDNTLKIWDIETGEPIRTLLGHTGKVNAVAVLSDGLRVISASSDNTLKVWDRETGNVLHTLEGHTHWVNTVALTPDSRRAISTSSDNTLKVWDLESGTIVHTMEVIESINTIAVIPDKQLSVIVLSNNTVQIWDIEKDDKQLKREGHFKKISAMSVSPDGCIVVSASWDYTLKVWDVKSGDQLHTLKGHKNPVLSVAVTPDGRFAISASWDNTVKIWDIAKGEHVHTLEGHSMLVNSVAVTPDGQRAISASSDCTLIIWDIMRKEPLYTLKGHTNWVDTIMVTPDGLHVLSASGRIFPQTDSTSNDHTLKVWNINTGELRYNLEGHISSIKSVAVTSDSRYVVSASEYGNLIVWDMESGKLQRKIQGHNSSIHAVEVLPDDLCAISASLDSYLKIWNIKTGEKLYTLSGHNSSITALTIYGQQGMSGSSNGIIIIWDMETKKPVASFTGDYSIETCAISPDGMTFVAGDRSGKVHFLRLEEVDTLL